MDVEARDRGTCHFIGAHQVYEDIPDHLVRDCAHLVGEAVFVAAILFGSDSDGSCVLLNLLAQYFPAWVRELQGWLESISQGCGCAIDELDAPRSQYPSVLPLQLGTLLSSRQR
jgi:hypothetical protein